MTWAVDQGYTVTNSVSNSQSKQSPPRQDVAMGKKPPDRQVCGLGGSGVASRGT
jgi:hypothetical protein